MVIAWVIAVCQPTICSLKHDYLLATSVPFCLCKIDLRCRKKIKKDHGSGLHNIVGLVSGNKSFLCRLRSIAAYRDHFVRRLYVCAVVTLSWY